ncbi:MAG: hypothetical protein ACM3UY_10720 [Methanocella sp.]|jgi:hypothetical protein
MNAIYSQNGDRYPLMEPYGTKKPTTGFELAPTTIAIAIIIIATTILVAASIVYFKKSRQVNHSQSTS